MLRSTAAWFRDFTRFLVFLLCFQLLQSAGFG